jgi:tetratricopeptide (TPR) repeat protein
LAAAQHAQTLIDEAQIYREAGDIRATFRILDRADGWLQLAARSDPDWSVPIILQGWNDVERVGTTEEGTAVQRADTAVVLEWIEDGLQEVNRLLSSETNNPEALELRGYLRVLRLRWSGGDGATDLLRQAQSDLESAVSRNENLPRAWLSLRSIYQDQGDFEAASHATRMARNADAWERDVEAAVDDAIFDALGRDDSEEATENCEFGRRFYPSNPRFIQCELTILGWTGGSPSQIEQAWRLLEQVERHEQGGLLAADWQLRRILVAAVAARAGLADSSRSIVNAARAGRAPEGRSPAWDHYEAWIEHLLGNTQKALRLLSRYLQANPLARQFVRQERWFRDLRDDPEFVALTSIPDS